MGTITDGKLFYEIKWKQAYVCGLANPATKNVHVSSKIGEAPVVGIGKHAFQNSDIESVTLPDSVTIIEDEAFANCKKLTAVVQKTNKNVMTVSIYGCAFMNCENLQQLQLNGSLLLTGHSAFEGCKKLQQIPQVASISSFSRAFIDCELLENVDIEGKARPYFYKDAFQNCIRLKTFHFLCPVEIPEHLLEDFRDATFWIMDNSTGMLDLFHFGYDIRLEIWV